MSIAQELEDAFHDRGVVRGRTLWLRADAALALIEAARQKRVRVLGVDGAYLGVDFTQPSQDHSTDLSQDIPPDTWTAASDFIRQQVGDLYFEVVLDG